MESLDGAFENVCELDLVFHFDEVRSLPPLHSAAPPLPCQTSRKEWPAHTRSKPQAHHILAEVIQGGLVLETNVHEIDRAGTSPSPFLPSNPSLTYARSRSPILPSPVVHNVTSARGRAGSQRVIRIRESALSRRRRRRGLPFGRAADASRLARGEAHGRRRAVAVVVAAPHPRSPSLLPSFRRWPTLTLPRSRVHACHLPRT